MTKREIPPNVFKHWAMCFRDGYLDDEYADELAEFLEFAANASEFDDALQEAYSKRPKYERTMN